MLHEANEKMQAEKAYRSNQGQTAGYCASDSNLKDCCETKQQPWSPPLIDQLSMRRSISADETSRLNRAITILNAHPEFEDLLWLIRSGLV